MTRRLLDLAGIGKDRLHLEWLSSAEAQRFAEVAADVTNSIKALGKLDIRALKMEINASEMTVNSEGIRWLVGKEVIITTRGDVYGRVWDTEKYEQFLDSELEREYHNNLIILAINDGFTSVRDISNRIDLDLLRVSYLLADLERTNKVEFLGMNDRIPAFGVI